MLWLHKAHNRNNFEQLTRVMFSVLLTRCVPQRHNSLWHLQRFKFSYNCHVSGYTLPWLQLLTAWSNNCRALSLSQAVTAATGVRISPQCCTLVRLDRKSGHVHRFIQRCCNIHQVHFQRTTEEN
jgi:hypothetical protein